ncbi:MAG: histidinol-phosphate transaminase [Ilumatobacteraceae bacterium]
MSGDEAHVPTPEHPGRPRDEVHALPSYRPGRDAAQAERDHGITGAVKLASNEMPEGPIGAVVDAVTAAVTGVNRYADHRAGTVREALATRLGLGAESVTVGNGSSGVLQQIFQTYVARGDRVLFPWRSFEVYPIYTRLAGGEAVTVPLDARLHVDVDGLIAALTPDTRLVVVATPNNPTGTATSTADLARLAEAAGMGTIVVVDEAYREFDDRGDDAVRDLVGTYPNVVVTRTLSKAQGLAGLRIGYGIGHPAVIGDIDKVALPFAVNALAQAAALAALDHPEEIAERVARVVEERIRVESALRESGWDLADHRGNFIWLPTRADTGRVALDLERAGVVVRSFGDEGIRVTIGTRAENDRFLTALAGVSPTG